MITHVSMGWKLDVLRQLIFKSYKLSKDTQYHKRDINFSWRSANAIGMPITSSPQENRNKFASIVYMRLKPYNVHREIELALQNFSSVVFPRV